MPSIVTYKGPLDAPAVKAAPKVSITELSSLSCLMPKTLEFQPSDPESVIVMVNVRRLAQPETGQKVANRFVEVNVVPLVL